MKVAYLILYLWHSAGSEHSYGGGMGGPAVQIVMVRSIAACEVLGRSAKELADSARPEPSPALYWTDENGRHTPAFYSPPASFRCVEVSK